MIVPVLECPFPPLAGRALHSQEAASSGDAQNRARSRAGCSSDFVTPTPTETRTAVPAVRQSQTEAVAARLFGRSRAFNLRDERHSECRTNLRKPHRV
jgi:hypothetical protein